MKIKSIELSKDKNGSPMKVVLLDNDKKVFVNSKYEPEIFEAISEDKEIETIEDGKFLKVKPESLGIAPKEKKGGGFVSKGVAEAQERKSQSISRAQDRTEAIWAKYGSCELVANHPAYKDLDQAGVKKAISDLTAFILNWKPTEEAPF